jgi:WD40 repeat protein
VTVTAPTTETPLGVDAPYVGLTHFTEEYADFFFGRDADCSVIVGNLCASRLTLLYAQSGVGKSSVLRAGVASRLRAQAMRDLAEGRPPRFVGVVFSTWTEDAVTALVAAIGETVAPFHQGPVDLSGRGLEDAVETATNAPGTTLLVILDQFEEYFLYHADDTGGNTFADQLARCVNRPNLRVNFLISIREDMYAGLGDLFRGRIAHVYGNFLHLDYLDEDGAREAVVRPIELLRRSRPEVGIEPSLVDAVLEGVRLRRDRERTNGHAGADHAEAGAGPVQIETAYLQLVMRSLWDEEVAAGSPVLRLETLERLGGTQEIIEGHLHGALQELSPAEQDAAAAAFRFLVTRAGTKIAWTMKDLSEVADVTERELDPVLRRLASPKLKVLRPVALRDGGDGAGASYEIFHDALARPIIRWREDHALARERAAKEEAQRQAAEASEREERERRRKRLALIALGAALFALVAGGVAFGVVLRNRADARLEATQSNDIANRVTGSRLAPGPAALAGLEAMRLSPTFGARSAAVGSLQENAGLPVILAGHSRSVLAVAFAQDGSGRIASGGADGTLRIWSGSGRALKTLQTESESTVTSVAFSPNGKLVATGQGDGSVDLWLPMSHRPVALLGASNACDVQCTPVAFSPGGTFLATGGSDGKVRVWDLLHLAKGPTSLVTESGVVRALAFSSDGRRLAAAENGRVVQWRMSPAGRLSDPLEVKASDPALAVAWARDGSIAAGVGNYVKIWPAHGATREFEAPDVVRAVAFLDGGSRVAYGGDDAAVTVRDVASGDEVGSPRSHGGEVNAIAVSPDGKTIASASDDRYVKLWRADAAGSLATVALGAVGMTNLGIGSGGRAAAGDRTKGPVRIWKPGPVGAAAGTARPATTLPGYKAPLAVRGAMLAAASVSSPDWFTLWNIGSSCPGMPRRPCRLGSTPKSFASDPLFTVAFSTSGTVLATGTEKELTLWDVSRPARPRLIVRHPVKSGVNQVAFDPADDSILATASEDGTVRLWRHTGDRLTGLAPQTLRNAAYAVTFSPDGKLLAAAGADQTVAFWNVEDPEHPRPISWPNSQTNSIFALAFSPEGDVLAAGDGDGGACLYNVASLSSIGSARCLTGSVGGSVDALAFDPSRDALLTTGRGEPVVAWSSLLWAASSDSALTDAVCRLAGRNLTTAEWSFAFVDTKLEGHQHRICP